MKCSRNGTEFTLNFMELILQKFQYVETKSYHTNRLFIFRAGVGISLDSRLDSVKYSP